jgi:hypothetical protein
VCIIVDTSLASQVFRAIPHPDFVAVFDWLHAPTSSGRMVVGGKLVKELEGRADSRRYLRELVRAGRALVFPGPLVDSQEKELTGRCRSDDPHVIALARLSGARTLCSADHDLQADFKNKALIDKPRGRVYSNDGHKHLLGHTSSCGYRPTSR